MVTRDSLSKAVKAAQTVLSLLTGGNLIVDGRWGSTTSGVYKSSNESVRKVVDSVFANFGLATAEVPNLVHFYSVQDPSWKASSVVARAQTDAKRAENQRVFETRVVPAIKAEAIRRGLDPFWFIGQCAQESEWGRRIPMLEDGRSSYNYAGIKSASIRSPKGIAASSREVVNGTDVVQTSRFAVFSSPEEFVKMYFWYLFQSGSAYRYKGLLTARSRADYVRVMNQSGYATDKSYGENIAARAARAEKVFA